MTILIQGLRPVPAAREKVPYNCPRCGRFTWGYPVYDYYLGGWEMPDDDCARCRRRK